LNRLLGHKKVIIRFLSLYSIGLVLFFISWTISYYLLPEGMLRGVGILPKLAGNAAASRIEYEFIRIFLINLFGCTIIIIGNYILRVSFFSFGYLVPLAWMIMYGVVLGTNSFSISLEEAMAPTLAIFRRSGLYEMMAGALFAVATNTISINSSESFFSSSKPVPKDKRVPMNKEQWVAVGIAVLTLAVAALREAYMITNLK